MKRYLLSILLMLFSFVTLQAQMQGDEEACRKANELYLTSIDLDHSGLHKEAAALCRRSYAIYDSLVLRRRDSMLYVAPRARVCMQLADYYYQLNEGTKSLLNAQNSIRFYKLAVSVDSLSFYEERDNAVPNLYIYISYGLLVDKKVDEALRYVDEALRLRRQLYELDPEQHRRALLAAVRVRGMVMAQVGNYDEAHAMYADAIELIDEMEETEPGTNAHNYQSIFFNIASAYYMAGNFKDALRANMKVLKLLRADVTSPEANRTYYLDYCYKYIANCYWCLAYEEYVASGNNKKSKEMRAYFQKAIDCYNMSLNYNPNDMESMSKLRMVTMIMEGMEKPQPINSFQ